MGMVIKFSLIIFLCGFLSCSKLGKKRKLSSEQRSQDIAQWIELKKIEEGRIKEDHGKKIADPTIKVFSKNNLQNSNLTFLNEYNEKYIYNISDEMKAESYKKYFSSRKKTISSRKLNKNLSDIEKNIYAPDIVKVQERFDGSRQVLVYTDKYGEKYHRLNNVVKNLSSYFNLPRVQKAKSMKEKIMSRRKTEDYARLLRDLDQGLKRFSLNRKNVQRVDLMPQRVPSYSFISLALVQIFNNEMDVPVKYTNGYHEVLKDLEKNYFIRKDGTYYLQKVSGRTPLWQTLDEYDVSLDGKWTGTPYLLIKDIFRAIDSKDALKPFKSQKEKMSFLVDTLFLFSHIGFEMIKNNSSRGSDPFAYLFFMPYFLKYFNHLVLNNFNFYYFYMGRDNEDNLIGDFYYAVHNRWREYLDFVDEVHRFIKKNRKKLNFGFAYIDHVRNLSDHFHSIDHVHDL